MIDDDMIDGEVSTLELNIAVIHSKEGGEDCESYDRETTIERLKFAVEEQVRENVPPDARCSLVVAAKANTGDGEPELTRDEIRTLAADIVAAMVSCDRDRLDAACEAYLRATIEREPDPYECAGGFFSNLLRQITGGWGATPEETAIAEREAPKLIAEIQAKTVPRAKG